MLNLGTSVSTIPPWKCNSVYGDYIEMNIAKFSCAHDRDCIAVVDEGCDGDEPFQLCMEFSFSGRTSDSACIYSVRKREGKKHRKKKPKFRMYIS